MKRIFALFFLILLAAVMPLWSQQMPSLLERHEEQLLYIGMRLDEVYKRFGSPRVVYAARGENNWQDDVVFVYNERELYFFVDRVWQVKVASIFDMKVGDAKAVAQLVLGEAAQDKGDFILCPIPGHAWPLSIRVNCVQGRIAAIYVFRSDY